MVFIINCKTNIKEIKKRRMKNLENLDWDECSKISFNLPPQLMKNSSLLIHPICPFYNPLRIRVSFPLLLLFFSFFIILSGTIASEFQGLGTIVCNFGAVALNFSWVGYCSLLFWRCSVNFPVAMLRLLVFDL